LLVFSLQLKKKWRAACLRNLKQCCSPD